MSVSDPMARKRESLVPGGKLGRVSMALRLLQGLAVVTGGVGVYRLRVEAGSVPPIIAFTADQRAITGMVRPYTMTDERFVAVVKDVTESALTRNENGLAAALMNYVTEPCATKLWNQYQRNRPKKGIEWVQTFKVDETDGVRIVSGDRFSAKVMVRGISSTRSYDDEKTARFYYTATFVPGPGGVDNPQGWRLNDIYEIAEAEFYAQERAQAAAAAVRVNPPR